jgi:hypothetical protein
VQYCPLLEFLIIVWQKIRNVLKCTKLLHSFWALNFLLLFLVLGLLVIRLKFFQQM